MDNIYPLVSCIMPTANRQRFIPFAIEYFKRQDYPNKELVVVDDGISSIQGLLPDDIAVKYLRIDGIISTGAKRNEACNLSSGEIIIHWDDDDWYASDWISKQVNTLINEGADICGLAQLYFYSPLQMKCWRYVYPPRDRPWVAGASMAYLKKTWSNNPFKNIKIGEDNMFVWDSHSRLVAHDYSEGFVAIIHPQNTSPKFTNNTRWRPIPISIVENILKDDFQLYTMDLMR